MVYNDDRMTNRINKWSGGSVTLAVGVALGLGVALGALFF